jgi:hypothetical protein
LSDSPVKICSPAGKQWDVPLFGFQQPAGFWEVEQKTHTADKLLTVA